MSPLGTFAHKPCQKSVQQQHQQPHKMKLFALLFTVAVATLAVNQVTAAKFKIRSHEDAVQAHEECHTDYKVPDDIYEKFLNYEFPQHGRTNCYVKCFLEKMGLFTELKGFNEKAIIAQFTSNNYRDLEPVRHGLEKCIDHNEAESDICTWANRVWSCWLPINRHVVRKIYGPKK